MEERKERRMERRKGQKEGKEGRKERKEGTAKRERATGDSSRWKRTPFPSYRDLEQQAGCRVTVTEKTQRTELAPLCARTRDMEVGL